MDIKEIAQKLAPGYWKRDQWNIEYFDSVGFAEALIESYKAELLKEVGEPVAARRKVAMWQGGDDYKYEWVVVKEHTPGTEPLYTSNQLSAAIIKATKPLEEEIERLKKHQCAPVCIFHEGDEREELKKQLATAQEENGRLENQVLARDAELWGRTQEILGLKDQLAKAEQLWQVAQGRCDGLEEKLAKAEQRVAEACAELLDGLPWRAKPASAQEIAAEIRSGKWRKFLKGE